MSGVVRHFDGEARSGRWSALYETVDPRTYQFHVRMARVLELLPAKLGAVLDLGCGTGVMARPVLDRGGTYLGIDVSPEMITEARARSGDLPGARFEVGDLGSLPIDDSSIDQVICMAVIEYLDTPDPAFAEIARVLRPGGTVVLTSPKRINLEALMLRVTAPARAILRRLTRKEQSQLPRTPYEPRDLDRSARAAGLLPAGRSLYYITPIPYPFTRPAPHLAMRVNRAFERFHASRSPLVGYLAQGFVARFDKPPVQPRGA